MPPGVREKLIQAVLAALAEATEGLKGSARHVLRTRARDFILDLQEAPFLMVEDFAADLLCALVGDPEEPDHVVQALVVVHRVVDRALVTAPPVSSFAALRPFLQPSVDQEAIVRFFRGCCGSCTVTRAFATT